uniref:DUF4220 domain-containing protein n=1 Tax=Oryza punctata TaxID=4537 RepID=A0A0E0MCX5_ORYPU
MANIVVTILHLISTTVGGLFRHDSTTGAASVEFWVAAATTLLLLRFIVDSIGPRFTSQKHVNPAVQLLRILNHYAVSYTLGLMPPSSSDQGTVANAFFKVWAVLIVTMQDSIRIGRPYQPKEMTLVDMLTSLWSANQLRANTPMHLRVPLWLMWSIHASRIVWYYITSSAAARARDDDMKLVSDYMAMPTQHTSNDASPVTMAGYKYIILGEEKLKQQIKVEPPSFTFGFNPQTQLEQEEVITVEKVWSQVSGDALLGEAGDSSNRFKDVCLSFALYKLLRRRFFNFPIHEASHPGTRQLVANAILDDKNGYERAFRVTEVELSFLQDFFYSKHADVFANGFPCVRLLLSLLMTASASYLAYAVHDMPSVSTGLTAKGRLARISHGVFVTHCIIAILVIRELWEIIVYVFSQWTNVLIICSYIRLRGRQGCWIQRLQLWMMEKVARIMFWLIGRGRSRRDHNIHQCNLVMSVRTGSIARVTRVIFRKLRREVKMELFLSLEALLNSQEASGSVAAGRPRSSPEELAQKRNELLRSYLGNAFADVEHLIGRIEHIQREIEGEGETHKILAWHVATSLCQIKLLEQATGRWRDDLYNLTLPDNGGGELADVWPHYVTAVTLSNYCAYLVTQKLVPDNGLIANKVFHEVTRGTVQSMRGRGTMEKLRHQLLLNAKKPRNKGDEDGIIDIGTLLSEELVAAFTGSGEIELWKRLGKFWAGFLLHLSASTRAAKHQVHLRGNGELTTHLWVLLSHAGFLGETRHGEQMLDPADLTNS